MALETLKTWLHRMRAALSRPEPPLPQTPEEAFLKALILSTSVDELKWERKSQKDEHRREASYVTDSGLEITCFVGVGGSTKFMLHGTHYRINRDLEQMLHVSAMRSVWRRTPSPPAIPTTIPDTELRQIMLDLKLKVEPA
jgi:hypothetical protein